MKKNTGKALALYPVLLIVAGSMVGASMLSVKFYSVGEFFQKQ